MGVSYKRLDDEHIGLFESMYDLEMNLRSQEKVDNLQRLMRDHFYYEEAQFCDALDLPWDYCKEHKKEHVKSVRDSLSWLLLWIWQRLSGHKTGWLSTSRTLTSASRNRGSALSPHSTV